MSNSTPKFEKEAATFKSIKTWKGWDHRLDWCIDKIERDQKELEMLKNETGLCEKHQPAGGHRNCLVCACETMAATLSRISYLCGPPNEMRQSDYDVHCNERAVLDQVVKLVDHLKTAEALATAGVTFASNFEKLKLLLEEAVPQAAPAKVGVTMFHQTVCCVCNQPKPLSELIGTCSYCRVSIKHLKTLLRTCSGQLKLAYRDKSPEIIAIVNETLDAIEAVLK